MQRYTVYKKPPPQKTKTKQQKTKERLASTLRL